MPCEAFLVGFALRGIYRHPVTLEKKTPIFIERIGVTVGVTIGVTAGVTVTLLDIGPRSAHLHGDRRLGREARFPAVSVAGGFYFSGSAGRLRSRSTTGAAGPSPTLDAKPDHGLVPRSDCQRSPTVAVVVQAMHLAHSIAHAGRDGRRGDNESRRRDSFQSSRWRSSCSTPWSSRPVAWRRAANSRPPVKLIARQRAR
jgi:hypothetical protein